MPDLCWFTMLTSFQGTPHFVSLPLTLEASCLLNMNQFSVIKPMEMAIPQPASAGYPLLYRSPRLELKYSLVLMLLRLKPAGLDFQFPPPSGMVAELVLPEDRLIQRSLTRL